VNATSADTSPTSSAELESFVAMVDALTVPASLHTPEGRFVCMNAGAEQAAGVSNAHMLGGHYLDLVSPEDRARVEEQFRRAVELGEPTDFGTTFIDSDGNHRWARAQHLPLKTGNRVIGVLILAWQTIAPGAPGLRREGLLTRRQLEVLQLVASGRSTAEIAAELHLAPQTVRNHVRDMLAQLGAHNRVEAVANAHHAGLLALRPLDPKPSRSS
jgi:PAS domain S-box-containing protein